MKLCIPFSMLLLAPCATAAGVHSHAAVFRDTVVKVRADVDVFRKLLPSKQRTALPAISSKRFIAIGGSLAAGVQNGGLYREAQLTAFPNLIARQIGVDFRQPLFSSRKGNGTGYRLIDKTAPVITYKNVVNALAVDSATSSLEPYSGAVDNYAFPHFGRRTTGFDNQAEGAGFVARLFPGNRLPENFSLAGWLEKSGADFFVYEAGFDDLVRSIRTNGGGISGFPMENLEATDEIRLLKRLTAKGARGVIATVPEVIKLPYFQQYHGKALKHLGTVNLQVRRSSAAEPMPFDPAIDLLLPGETAEKLQAGELSGTVALQDHEVLSRDPYDDEFLNASPAGFNKFKIRAAARAYNLAVADLYTLFEQILGGEYVTHDGVKINPQWPDGNFFSSDGLYPTPLGQAVIANEYIKAANDHYHLSIPLIETKNFVTR